MLFRRKRIEDQAVPGAVFHRLKDGNVVERAVIAWAGRDGSGIQHVRFHVETPGHDGARDTKVLALAVFAERYRPGNGAPAA
jgi:hypothetical protein